MTCKHPAGSTPDAPAARSGGFTLVEVAIVLVVIGLILGVVLNGQALIRNAEYRTFKSQIGDYQTSFYAFRDRYNGVPGDFSAAAARLGLDEGDSGNGNGIIDGGPACSDGGDEACKAWQHLRAAGFIQGRPTQAGPDARPAHPYAGVFSGFFTGAQGNGVFGHKLLIVGIPGDIARRLDGDIDDAQADRGRISCFDIDLEDGDGSDCPSYPGSGATTAVVFEL